MGWCAVFGPNGYSYYDSRQEDAKRIKREIKMEQLEREARMNGIQSKRPFDGFEGKELPASNVAAGVVPGGKAALEYRDEA